MTAGDTLAPAQRLVILRALMDQPEYTGVDSYLHGVLRGTGLPAYLSTVHALLDWLATQGLAEVHTVDAAAGPTIATLTQRGLEVATGTDRVDGVQRPSPRDVGAAMIAAAGRLAGGDR